MATKANEGMTLTETLAVLGWRHEAGSANAEGRVVFDDTGARLGQLTAQETWDELRRRGLIASTSTLATAALLAASTPDGVTRESLSAAAKAVRS